MLFSTADIISALHIKSITQSLQRMDGLCMNPMKKKIYFSTSCTNKNEILHTLQLQESCLPARYLGVPTSSNYLHYSDCTNLFQRVVDRFENWDNNKLSMAGMAELIHTVITPMVLYWLLVYHMPTAILLKLDSLCPDFF